MPAKNKDMGACCCDGKTCCYMRKGRSEHDRAAYTSCNKHGKFLEYKNADRPELNSCDYPSQCDDYRENY